MWLLVSISEGLSFFFLLLFFLAYCKQRDTFRAVHAVESREAMANARIALAVAMAIARALLDRVCEDNKVKQREKEEEEEERGGGIKAFD